MRGLVTYTTRRLKTLKEFRAIYGFLKEAGDNLTGDEMYPEFKGFMKMNPLKYAEKARFIVCFRDDEPVGLMLSRIGPVLFDPNLKMLKQDLLYAKPNTRAAYYLMKEFLDFGKNHADHIITMIGARTNVKRQSLEKLGFKKLEELYRIEV